MTVPDFADAIHPETPPTGAELLDRLHAELTSFVVLPTAHAADAVCLWIATTHAVAAFEFAPRLAITSPEKRCGKSRLLDVIEATCHDPIATADTTPAALVRSIGRDAPPTVLIDEADAKFGSKRAAEQNEDLRAMLNAGFQRGRDARRCVGPMSKVEQFPTFAMVALAAIGGLPDTITDRAINVRMQRRPTGRTVAKFRLHRDKPRLRALGDDFAEWAGTALDALRVAEPRLPVDDRAADTWEPLVAVADAAGGSWPARARRACTAMTAEAEQADTEASLGRLLLAGVREAFTTTRLAEIPSAELVTYLRAIEDAPWSAFDLDQRKLARRLNEYAVTPGQIYVTEPGGKRRQARGYRLTGFTDAFARYLSDPSDDSRPDASSSVTPSSEQVTPVTDNGRVTDTSVTQTVSVTGLSSADDEVTDHDAPDPQTAEPRCATCTQPLLLRTPGRKQCERCRLKEKP
ncbi:MAG: DUF3631 domain-containing protein [Pseudonocardiaceae bacterium]